MKTMKALISDERIVMIEINGEARYFISMGNPGFNLRANNLDGYATHDAAMKASLRCQDRA